MASDIAAPPAPSELAATLRRELLEIFDETFRRTHGIFLDGGTSLFETLGGVGGGGGLSPRSGS